MADVSHRTFEEKVYDGTTGAVEHTKTTHQIGVEVDGVFVPFVTKEGSYVDRLVENGLRDQDAAAKQQENQTSSASQG
jgi:hypothetical protein